MKTLKALVLVVVVLMLVAAPALAYTGKSGPIDPTTGAQLEVSGPDSSILSGAAIAGGLGMGLTIIGAGIGLGRIGGAALDGMARQPEVAPRIQTAMIIVAAMLEGATLASLVFCLVVGLKATF
jgi:F-type H+-transporting ATPase subunit c